MKFPYVLTLIRWVTMLGLSIWLGGIIFLGAVSAPAIFRFCRAQGVEPLAPQLVGALVARFAPLTMVVGGVLFLAWLLDGWFSNKRAGALQRRLWSAQGIGLVLMLALALYLNLGVLPEMLREQATVIRESAATGTPLSATADVAKSAARLHFDVLHQRYSQLTMVVFWLGAGALALLSARLSTRE